MNQDRSWTTIEVVAGGAAAYLRLNRPERRNTVTPEMVEEVHAALVDLADRDEIRVVVLTGNGSTFCPGADLQREPGAPARLPDARAYQSATLLVEMPQITVAAINGACAGAGIAWAAACDLRIASSSARFALAFLDVGLAGELGLAWTLTRSLGAAKARELFLIPRKFDAREAAAMGFVSAVHDAADFSEQLSVLVEGLCSRDPVALRDVKANLLDAARLPLREYIELESARHTARWSGEAAAATFDRLIARGQAISSPASPPPESPSTA